MEYKEKEKHKKFYMKCAVSASELSYCERSKVGAVLVKDQHMSYGYNGTVTGTDNKCEDDDNRTKEGVLHAERNAIAKAAREAHFPIKGSVLYVTMSPCKPCAEIIAQSGVSEVYYLEEYRITDGIDFLRETCKIPCIQLNIV